MTLAYCTSACYKIDPPDSNGATEHHDLRVGTACPFHQNCTIHSGTHFFQPVFAGIIPALKPPEPSGRYWIRPYRDSISSLWVFDDPFTGLVKEPFVRGAGEVIDFLVARRGLKHWEHFWLIFDSAWFFGWDLHLKWVRAEDDGNVYRTVWQPEGIEAWLCPALLKYYPVAPKDIYVACLVK